MSESPTVVVLAGVIERGGRFLITRRPSGTHLSGFWEFPGGKCEPGETHHACLARELAEELGVAATMGEELLVTEHAYPERRIRLHFVRCQIAGEPDARLGQQMRWATREELRSLDFPPADEALIAMLTSSPARN